MKLENAVGSDRNCSNDTFARSAGSSFRYFARSRGQLFGVAFATLFVMASGCGDDDDDSSATGGSHSGGKASGGKASTASGGNAGGVSGGVAGGTSGGQTSGGASSGGAQVAGAGPGGANSGGADVGGAGGAPTNTGGGATGGDSGGGAVNGGDTGSSEGGTVGTAGETNGGTAGAGNGGSVGEAGSSTGGASSVPRPQLTSEQAAEDTILKHLEKAGSLITGLVTDNWDPTAGLGDLSTITPTYHVAATGGTHTTVQDAITAAAGLSGVGRVYIQVDPGTYREVVCVPVSAPPITLYSADPDASRTVIVFDNYNAKPKAVDTPANPCSPNLAGANYGVSGSATFAAYANGFQAKNLSFVNDTDEVATGLSKSLQAVALITQGDQLVFDNVRVSGNQYALYVKTPNVSTVYRAYFKNSYVEGDLEFIIGRGTFVLDGCEVHYLTSRQGSNNSYIVAPSTDSRNPYGILIVNANFTAEVGTPMGNIYLGHAWDESQTIDEYRTAFESGGVYPNGQALIRNSVLGEHIRFADPWAKSTNNRPFSTVSGVYPANRLFEFANTGAGSATP